jgi:hypothetical protein
MLAVILAVAAGAKHDYERAAAQLPPARPLAAALLEYHQAAVRMVNNNPNLSGILVPTLPNWHVAAGRFVSCTSSGLTATWTIPTANLPAQAISAEMQDLYKHALGTGIAAAGTVLQRNGTLALPAACNVPDGVAVAVTRSF